MDSQLLLVGGGIAVAVAAFGAVLLAPSEQDKAKKRAAHLTGKGNVSKTAKASGSPDNSKERRRQVADSLKKIEDAQAAAKDKKKVSLDQMLDQAGFEISVRNFYLVSAVVGLLFVGLGFVSGQKLWVVGAMGLIGGLGVPRWFVGSRRKKRQKKFVNEFSNAIDVIVRGVKSGLPVNECLKIIARDAQEPVRTEFHLLTEGLRLGLSLEQSLDRMYKRMPINEVNFFAIVLLIQQQTGGNLAEALSNLGTVLRNRKSMLGKIAALSMEAKASAAILGSMPFIVSTLVHLSNPDYLLPLFTTKFGNMLLLGAGLWMCIGVFIMKNMINIKV